ncbi:MAG: beta-lactamase [Solimicrobium sp.]|nr:beta-lactamase [Solimicrobium sp.]
MNTLYSSHKSILAIAMALIFSLSGCGSSTSSSPSYDSAIAEGRVAAQKVIDQNEASAITVALVDKNHIIWSQSFGFADPIASQVSTNTTMFGIGSVSKIIATIAVMKLVERGVIDLDTPLVTYLPTFKMVSEEYKKVTVRMLLNYSAGFPGSDYRNLSTRTPFPTHADQVLQTLSQSRLKFPPGYMHDYCNDCFAIIEPLILAKTGKHYTQFVQDEILTPLNMKNSAFPTHEFEPGSYAKAIKNGIVKPQEFINSFATGGLYSTAEDMARVAMMFLGAGAIDSTQILLQTSVAQMAKNQTTGTFKPVHSNTWAFGLGWDSISQPGLLAVGYDGWAKGGDSGDYGAEIIVSPRAGLGVVVIGASSFSSEKAKVIAERILLRALAENHKIRRFPAPLKISEPQRGVHTGNASFGLTGVYGISSAVLKFEGVQGALFSGDGWTPIGEPLKALNREWFAKPENTLINYKIVDANRLGENAQYLITRSPSGYGHYLDSSVLAEKIQNKYPALSSAWQKRLRLTWLVVNENPDELTWNGMDPRLRLVAVPELEGLIAVRAPTEPDEFHILDSSKSDTDANMMLTIPQLNGRDLNDLHIFNRDGTEWARLGSYMHQPIESVSQLVYDRTETILIGPEGYAEWRAVAPHINPVHITITTASSWRLYDATFKSLSYGKGSGVAILPSGSGTGYLTLFGTPGQAIAVTAS